jgi:hypothetical protein
MHQNQLEHLWTRQLRLEFLEICARYRIDLELPLFEISSSRSRCGSWHPEIRTMKISRTLIEEHSWDVVLNVLKHEVAHQICSELFHVAKTGHGREFAKACTMLNLAPAFQGAGGDLESGPSIPDPASIENEAGRAIIAKVKKLLALAGSDNRHEASLAMEKACALMTIHNLKQLENDVRDGYTYLIIETKQKNLATYKRSIGAILRDYFHVEVVCSSLYDASADQTLRTIELLGRHENVVIAEHCYHFLEERLDALWPRHKTELGGNGKRGRNSFYLGLLRGFREKLADQADRLHKERIPVNQHDKQGATLGELMLIEDKTLQEFAARRYGGLRRVTKRGPMVHRDTYQEAVAKGREIVFHTAVSSESNSRGLLLTSRDD